MKTLLDLYPHALEQNLATHAVNGYMDALVNFLMPKEFSVGQYKSFGTGFFIYSANPTVAIIATAKHVLEDFDFAVGRVVIGNRLLSLGDIGIRILDPRFDAAQWILQSNDLLAHGVHGIQSLSWQKPNIDKEFEPLDSFSILGYPGSKNKRLDFRDGKSPDRYVHQLVMHGSQLNPESMIRSVSYRGSGYSEAINITMTNPPPLDGMSGSPCQRFAIHRDTGKLALLLDGVFYAWRKKSHSIEIASFANPWGAV